MIPALAVHEFAAFFQEVHGHKPFPWQERLLRHVAQPRGQEEGLWPDVLDLPTGFGKTAALDIALFHLALEADRGRERQAPVRIAFVVDRRLVVDDAFERAKRIACRLRTALSGSVTSKVAERLRWLAGKGNSALVASRLRGGIPREDDWARTPSQPTILCSTVDQVGSRLLFRGYGLSDSMKPVHAGLVGADCLILLDEAHLSEPFRQTLKWVKGYRAQCWREDEYAAPWGVALLTATLGVKTESSFRPTQDDYDDPILQPRWAAPKPARLIDASKTGKKKRANEDDDQQIGAEEREASRAQEQQRTDGLAEHALEALKILKDTASHPVIAVVANRVARAREVFEELRKRCRGDDGADTIDLILMIGPVRPVDRDDLAKKLEPIRTGANRTLEKPLVIVATQCIEAGVDIDLDGLITESAPLDALRQRFGRLNRNGRGITPYAAIIGHSKADKKDPVYGEAIAQAWNYLIDHRDECAGQSKGETCADFGLKAFAERTRQQTLPKEALAPRLDAPVLLPTHLDLLSQTAPIPNADPEVALYLHGPNRAADAVTLLWREDVDPDSYPSPERATATRRLLLLIPPRVAEAIELPVWAVRRWLTQPKADFSELTDIPGPIPEESEGRKRKLVFRWAGDDDKSRWIDPRDIRPGCTIVVPASYGGVDECGWNPHSSETATDVADRAAEAFEGRRFVVRVAPELFEEEAGRNKLGGAIANTDSGSWRDLRNVLCEVLQAEAERLRNSPGEETGGSAAKADRLKAVADRLQKLEPRKGKVQTYPEIYGRDEEGRSRGVVFVAPFGIRADGRNAEVPDGPNSTEDDFAGSLPGYAQPLEEHCASVEVEAAEFAERAGLPPDRITDLKVAAYLHDAGKADQRFQSWLAYGDPFGPDPEKSSDILAKSGRSLPRDARRQSELPEKWRHEAFSVRLAEHTPRFNEARDQDLVLWLIGTHHGHGRPLFPHADPADAETRTDLPAVLDIPRTLLPGPGPQSLAWDRDGYDWPALYERLKTRYGLWELARMEAVLRLADHRASEKAAVEDAS